MYDDVDDGTNQYFLIHIFRPIFKGTKKECSSLQNRIINLKPNEVNRLMIMPENDFDDLWNDEDE